MLLVALFTKLKLVKIGSMSLLLAMINDKTIMKIRFLRNTALNCPRWECGSWSCDITGLTDDDVRSDQLVASYRKADVSTLFELIGIELHTQQQGQCDVYFMSLVTYPVSIADAAGLVDAATILQVGDYRYSLGDLCKDFELEFE